MAGPFGPVYINEGKCTSLLSVHLTTTLMMATHFIAKTAAWRVRAPRPRSLSGRAGMGTEDIQLSVLPAL